MTIELEQRLKQKERELYSIQKISRALSNTLNLDDLLRLIMGEITELMDADRSTLYLVDRQRNEIWSKIALKAEVKEIRQTIGVGISGHVAKTGEIINIPDAYNDDRFDPSTDKRTGYRTRSILCLPVWEPLSDQSERQIIGVIQVLNKSGGPFAPEDEAILKSISSEVAISLKNAQLYQQLENKFQEIDLLYEFEQSLSSNFELQNALQTILQQTKLHLNATAAGIIFKRGSDYHFYHVAGDQYYFAKNSAALNKGFENFLEKGGGKPEGTTLETLQYYLPNIKSVQLNYLHALSFVQPNEFLECLYFVSDMDLSDASGNKILINLVVQKVARAVELAALRDSLFQKERLSAIGQMMSTIVHDLRNPVNNVYGFMELLLDESCTAEERKEYAEIVRLEVNSITNMTAEILDFAKGKTSILPRKTSLKKMLKRLTPQFNQLFKNSNFTFEIENSAKNYIHADEDKLIRVFLNIAKNAREAMKPGGKFLFRVSDDGDFVRFEMTDDGPGIPEDIRDHLFDSFVTSGKENGTGLGLAIVKKIVEEHKGNISVNSREGRGTTFFIKIPIYQMAQKMNHE